MDAVVTFGQGAARRELLQPNKLEALALEAAKDLAHQPPLNAIGLDGDKAAFDGHGKGRNLTPSSAAALPLGKQEAIQKTRGAPIDLRIGMETGAAALMPWKPAHLPRVQAIEDQANGADN